MSANYGFVYVLRNDCMPGIYKIGMTDRAPSRRAEEISSATAAPMPFEVVCFAEVDDALQVEREIHEKLSAFRVSGNREFFALTGDDLTSVFSYLTEQFCFVAYGDISFLSDTYSRSLIRRAQLGVMSSDLAATSKAVSGLAK